MKKLVAILVICVFAVSLYAVDNPFTFGVSNEIKLKTADDNQPGKTADANTAIGNSPANDFKTTKTALDDAINCSASITIAEIYTLGSYLGAGSEFGFGGDSLRIEFKTGLTNSIKVVPDYLTIGIDVDWVTQWESREKKTGDIKEADMNVDVNNDGDKTDSFGYDNKLTGQAINFFLKPKISFKGGIPDSGFSWSLSEMLEFGFDPENWKDSDPTYQSFAGGNVYTTANKMATGVTQQFGVFNHINSETGIGITFDFGKYFMPENFSMALDLSHTFKVKMPYSYYEEIQKEIENEGYYGIKLGLAGVSVGMYFFLDTQDYLNSSAPLNGSLGSFWDYTGTTYSYTDTATFKDNDVAKHDQPNAKIGPKITFGYSKEWFSFGTTYKGYLTGLRKWDDGGQNGNLKWCNEFEIAAKFGL